MSNSTLVTIDIAEDLLDTIINSNDVLLLVYERRGWLRLPPFFYLLPEVDQKAHIFCERCFGNVGAGGADNISDSFWQFA